MSQQENYQSVDPWQYVQVRDKEDGDWHLGRLLAWRRCVDGWEGYVRVHEQGGRMSYLWVPQRSIRLVEQDACYP